MNYWGKIILFTFTVLLPAIVVGISNFTAFPDSSLPVTLMLIVTVGVAGVFTWATGAATAKIARYCIITHIVICAILAINLGGHWLFAREVSAAREATTERHGEEDRALERRKAETEMDLARANAEAEKAKAETARAQAAAQASNAERRLLGTLPLSERRLHRPASKPAPAPTLAPQTAPTIAPLALQPITTGAQGREVKAPPLTVEQVKAKWWWFLTALAFLECLASILGGAIMAGSWEWDRNRNGIPDDEEKEKPVVWPKQVGK